MLRYKTATRP